MKKTILFAVMALALNVTTFAQAPTYVENFDSTLASGSVYHRMYIVPASDATITSTKPSASELSLSLTNVSAYDNGVGFLLGTRNNVGGWDPIDLRGKNVTVKLMVKSTEEITSLRIQLTDNATPGKFLNHFFTIPGGNVMTTLEHTFSPAEITASQIDLSAVDGLLLNFNAIGDAVNSTVTFDMISVGEDITTSTLASDINNNNVVYPNPCSDIVNFESSLSKNANITVSLCDMVGKVITTYKNNNSNLVKGSFDVSNLEKGLYTITYNLDGALTNSKIVMVK